MSKKKQKTKKQKRANNNRINRSKLMEWQRYYCLLMDESMARTQNFKHNIIRKPLRTAYAIAVLKATHSGHHRTPVKWSVVAPNRFDTFRNILVLVVLCGSFLSIVTDLYMNALLTRIYSVCIL